MQRQLEAMGLEYTFIRAVDGKALSQSDLQKYSRKRALKAKGRELSTGEIGCALSHADMHHRMVDDGIDEVLILEDDIFITRNLLEVLKRRRHFPSDWDVVNFANTWAKPIPLGEPIFENHRICTFEDIANRASAYLINRKGAGKLIAHVHPIRLPADDIIGYADIAALNLYGITPAVVRLAEFQSDIWDYDGQLKDLKHANRIKKWIAARMHGLLKRFLVRGLR